MKASTLNFTRALCSRLCPFFAALWLTIIIPNIGYANSSFSVDFAEEFELAPLLLFTDNDPFTSLRFSPGDCCDNATTPSNGQFQSTITIRGTSGATWYIESATNVYFDNDCQEPPVNVPFDFLPDGNGVFTEMADGGESDSSTYTLNIITVDGLLTEVVLRALSEGESYSIGLGGQSEEYNEFTISGPRSVCTDNTITYTIEEGVGDMGDLTETSGSPDVEIEGDGPSYQITFNESGDYEFQFMTEDGDLECYKPTTFMVSAGLETGASIFCKGPQNLSLGTDCELTITPAMVLAITPEVGMAFTVMILDKNGNIIPEATFTEEHVGHSYTVKVIDGCSGNSCWSEIKVEDKLAPVILCPETADTLFCFNLGQDLIPFASDNCSEVEINLTSSILIPFDCEDPLSDEFIGIETRSYVAFDEAGNFSEICDREIYVRRIPLDEVEGPENFSAACDEITMEVLDNGDLDPEYFGVPSIDGIPLWPNEEGLCGISAIYTDKDGGVIGTSGVTKKVIRTWEVFEWVCNSVRSTGELTQIISITDDEAPEIVEGPTSLKYSADSEGCVAHAFLPPIRAIEDDCIDEKVNYRVDGLLNTNGGHVELPIGEYTINYIAMDDRGNADTLEVPVVVEDNTIPYVTCLQYIVITLDEFGEASLPAYAVDNGSKDACGIDFMEIRRMDSVSCVDSLKFAPKVNFCCEDAGLSKMVELRVWDINGNFNTCMVEVEVQDKIKPLVEQLPDMRVPCGTHIKLSDLEIPEVSDACAVTILDTLIFDLNSCGVGTILRRFIARDAFNECIMEHTITVFNEDVFQIEPEDWPADVDTVAVCDVGNLDPENLPPGAQRPKLPDDFCTDLYVNHNDDIYQLGNDPSGSCFKIIRTWTVLDWCNLDENDNPARYTHDQVIKVTNLDQPEIITPLDSVGFTTQFCDEGMITLTAMGMDSCTADADLEWSYELDMDNDGSIDIGPIFGKGKTADASGTYDVGEYTIIWRFFDECGNSVTGRQKFSLMTEKPPVIAGKKNITVGLTPMDTDGDKEFDTEMACINVDSLIASSSHPCDKDFDVSFSPDSIVKEMCFDCQDIGIQMVPVYAIDVMGNKFPIIITIDVQDNNAFDLCSSPCDCVEFPENLDIATCNPDFTAIGQMSRPMVADTCNCLNFTIDSSDVFVGDYPNEECVFLERTWTVTFNCGLRPLECSQVQRISVRNVEPPQITCPTDTIRTVSAEDACEAMVDIGLPTVDDTCNTGVVITNSFNNGGADASGIYPVGTTKIKYIAVDDCGNADSCHVVVIVTDGIPPVCEPMSDITVSIADGTGVTILPEDIDSASMDNCGIDRFELSDSTFTCDQIGMTNITTTFIVYDLGGNSSECEVRVTVEDEVDLTCRAIPNLTVYLDEMGNATLDASEIDAGSGAGCNIIPSLEIDRRTFDCNDIALSPITVTLTVMANGETEICSTQVTVKDTFLPEGEIIDPDLMLDCSDFDGDFLSVVMDNFRISDNCDSSTVDVAIKEVNEAYNCGEGVFVYKLILTDICNNVDSTDEAQIIITNNFPFTRDSIEFPEPGVITVMSCGADITPTGLGSELVIHDTGNPMCSRIGVDTLDELLTMNNNCVDTIRRIWIVRDSCQMDGSDFREWRDTQLILINDMTPPVINVPPDMTFSNSNDDEECEVVVVMLAATATDDCSESGNITITNDSDSADDPDSGDISGEYEPGEYTIRFTATDECGNSSMDSIRIVIEQPSGVGLPCIKFIANITSSGFRSIIPSNFGVLRASECYDPTGLTFSFDRNNIDSNLITYSCDDVGRRSPDNPLGLNINIYAFDAEGEFVDSCRTTVAIADQNNNCDGNRAEQQISGEITTADGSMVEGVKVMLRGDTEDEALTSSAGNYAFDDLLSGSSLTVVPYKNDDLLNGVNTLDLIKIQRHILGIQEFTSLYQLIAADVNHSMTLTASDILSLRKAILGINDYFPNNTSWRMIEQSYIFPFINDPFVEQWPENYEIDFFTQGMKIDFTGVKVGDVDGDARPNSRDVITTRSAGTMSLSVQAANNRLLVKATNNMLLQGFQLSLRVDGFDTKVSSELEGFGPSNSYLDDGVLRISYNHSEGIYLKEDAILFSIAGSRNAVVFHDNQIVPQLYVNEKGNLDSYSLVLEEELENGLSLGNNHPNPWVDFTEINYTVDYEDQFRMNFYDATGRLIYSELTQSHKGKNIVRVSSDNVDATGLIFYELVGSKDHAKGKMIIIR